MKDGEVARVNPGVHAVRASRGGTVVFERKLEIEQSTSVEVVVNAPEAPPSTTSSSAPNTKLVRPESELPEPGSGWVRAWPLLGVGLAFGAGFVVTRIAANSAARDVEENCRTQRAIVCDTDAAGGSRVRAYETLSFVSAGLALTAFGAGIAIKITSHSKASGAKSVIKPAVGLMNGITLEHQF